MSQRMMEGGLVNRLMERDTPPTPEVGMGGTLPSYTDRSAVTVVAVGLKDRGLPMVGVQADRAIRTDTNGMSDAQQYRYEPQPDAPVVHFTLRRNGKWIRRGESMNGGQVLCLGYRSVYHDYSF